MKKLLFITLILLLGCNKATEPVPQIGHCNFRYGSGAGSSSTDENGNHTYTDCAKYIWYCFDNIKTEEQCNEVADVLSNSTGTVGGLEACNSPDYEVANYSSMTSDFSDLWGATCTEFCDHINYEQDFWWVWGCFVEDFEF